MRHSVSAEAASAYGAMRRSMTLSVSAVTAIDAITAAAIISVVAESIEHAADKIISQKSMIVMRVHHSGIAACACPAIFIVRIRSMLFFSAASSKRNCGEKCQDDLLAFFHISISANRL